MPVKEKQLVAISSRREAQLPGNFTHLKFDHLAYKWYFLQLSANM